MEWTAQIGQAVKEDDVVALLETDKVTIDIKAERSGVVVAGRTAQMASAAAAVVEIPLMGSPAVVAALVLPLCGMLLARSLRHLPLFRLQTPA